eukprot:s724_g2.t1
MAKAKVCGNCAKPLPATAMAGAWCAACAYPPCQECGQARPNDTRYHVGLMPTWTCAECKVKPCSHCGQPLDSQALAGTLCMTCSYPPCDTCGRPRPQKTSYHVTMMPQWTMPQWTCQACTQKSCAQCGQVLGAHAREGAFCLACAYPPCENCGGARPQKHDYHARVMPTWTCATCCETKQSGVPRKRRRTG